MANRIFILLGLCLIISAPCTARSQIVVHDLSAAIAEGSISLVTATGTGASSGASVEGALENRTETELNINVYLVKPVFFVNRGKGQNMIASQVYHGDGAYRSDGRQFFITLKPRQRANVVFVAYCADFEKDNPSLHETFEAGEPPQHLEKVLANITDYARHHPKSDITVAAQVAVWLAQGESPKKIAEKFAFTAPDEQLARSFLR